MVAPLVKLTIGKMFDSAPGLVNNVSLTVPDQSTWDINPNLELPKYIEASIDYQYIGEYPLQAIGKHYGLTYMKDDGSALTTELDATLSDVNRGRYSSGRASAFDNSGYAERQNMIGRARQASHDDIIESQINDKMIGGIASLRQQVLGNG
jgi:hypothetical protein